MPELTWLRIANRTDRCLSLHWIDGGDVRRFHAEVPPRTTRMQPATPGRPWAVVEPDGRERAVYYPDSVARTIVIDDTSDELVGRLLPAPPGMSLVELASGAIGVERVLPDGRAIWEPDVQVLDEFDAGAGAVAVYAVEGERRMRIMMWDFPDASAAAGFAVKLVELYAEYVPRVPDASTFEIPDGRGVRGIFGGPGGGALGACNHGSVGLVALVVGGDDDVAVVRSAIADQRARLA